MIQNKTVIALRVAVIALAVAFGGALIALGFVMVQGPTPAETIAKQEPVRTEPTRTEPTRTEPVRTTPTQTTPDVASGADAGSGTSSNSDLTPTVVCAADGGSCNEDAKTWCPDEWAGVSIEASWKLDLVRCLYDEHKDDITADCRSSLECRQGLNEALMTACAQDKKTYCSGVEPTPGAEPLVDCIEENLDLVSTACAQAWVNHDYAKPE